MKEVFVRNEFNYDMDQASFDSGCECKDPSLTNQSMAEEADINTIVRRFGISGELPINVVPPEYGDYEDVFDFQSALNSVREAQESFMRFPAAVRSRFDNDPQKFMDFCTEAEDGKLVNIDEMRKLGLAVPAPADAIPVPASADNVTKPTG